MPADIRNFFGGKADPNVPKQEKPPGTKDNLGTGKKRRSKARVIVDDSDDELPPKSEKVSPKKGFQKNLIEKSPQGKETTTTDYFASSSKSGLKKSTPGGTRTESETISPKAIPRNVPAHLKKDMSVKAEANGRRLPKRNGARKSYDRFYDSDEAAFLDDDAEAGDDIFTYDADRGRRRKDDGYLESDSEEDLSIIDQKQNRRRKLDRGKYEDVDMKDVSKSCFVGDREETITTINPARGGSALPADKKRKLPNPEYEEDPTGDTTADTPKKGRKAKNNSERPAKKSRAGKEKAPENAEIQAIFDSIPIVRAPTPPPRDVDDKFDWRAAGPGNTGPPPAAGAKELPRGEEDCLAGLTFVFTGLLETLSREAAQELVKRHGGRITGTPSSKTSYVVLGSDAGPSKLEKIRAMNIKTVNEDGLFELIRRLPAGGGGGKAAEKTLEKRRADEEKVKREAAEMDKEEKRLAEEMQKAEKNAAAARGFSSVNFSPSKPPPSSQLWTTKYAPTKTNQICGNKGQVEKIQRWLEKWQYNRKHSFMLAGADGSGKYRALIIHGPPGIGKTTAAHLAAKLEGFDVIESNASDTRSKKLVESGLSEILNNSSLLGFFAGDGKEVNKQKKNIVLIMDEVDGMSAGDRGGVGALAKVCKKTDVPMILICNERRSPKMKPFDHVAYDVMFKRPTVEQVRSRIATICVREGLKIPTQVMDALIEGSNKDIRQIINMLSAAKLDKSSMDFDEGKSMSKAWEKHIVLKPWDICNKLLGGGMFASASKATLNDKIELYFNDHELSFLMIQENYLSTRPMLVSNQGFSMRQQQLKTLELADKAAESISDGDLVDRMIHGSQQQWSLMPAHAVFSTVIPSSFMSGSLSGNTSFPVWLGNNSKQGKMVRYIREIQAHMRLRTSGDRHEVRQQYLPVLWELLIGRLAVEGKDSVEDVITLMDSYFLTKDDFDFIMELGLGPQSQDGVKLETATKSAFTRLYNAQSHPLPFMKASNVAAAQKGLKTAPDLEEAIEEEDDGDVLVEDQVQGDDDENGDLLKDKYIKKPKALKSDASKKPVGKKGKKGRKDVEVADVSDNEPRASNSRTGKTKDSVIQGKAKK